MQAGQLEQLHIMCEAEAVCLARQKRGILPGARGKPNMLRFDAVAAVALFAACQPLLHTAGV